jgi:hypothetical protein
MTNFDQSHAHHHHTSQFEDGESCNDLFLAPDICLIASDLIAIASPGRFDAYVRGYAIDGETEVYLIRTPWPYDTLWESGPDLEPRPVLEGISEDSDKKENPDAQHPASAEFHLSTHAEISSSDATKDHNFSDQEQDIASPWKLSDDMVLGPLSSNNHDSHLTIDWSEAELEVGDFAIDFTPVHRGAAAEPSSAVEEKVKELMRPHEAVDDSPSEAGPQNRHQ